MSLEPGEIVERYQVEAMLGSGGSAAVYRVRHLHLGTIHALKVLLVPTPVDRERLLAEGQVQARLAHPNVVAVTDVLLVHRSPALVMELVDGPTLEHHLGGEPGLPLAAALDLFRGVVAGVGAAHAAGLVHRDLKPANVLLGRRGGTLIAKVTDFGLVRSIDAPTLGSSTVGHAVGTPAYMAPEQIRDPSGVDERADLWGLGCILYELVCGKKAFPQSDPFQIYSAIAAGRYLEPTGPIEPLPPRITGVIRELLEIDRDRRLASCEALWERLWSEPAPPELCEEALMALTPPVPMAEVRPIATRAPPRPLGHSARPSALWFASSALVGGGVTLLVGALIVSAQALDLPLGGQPEIAPALPDESALPAFSHAESVAVESSGDAREGSPLPRAPAAHPREAGASVSTADLVMRREVGSRPVEGAPEVIAPGVIATGPAPGRVSVEGDAEEVWLEANGERYDPALDIPPGQYRVRARWKDGIERTAGGIELHPDEKIQVRCASFVFACIRVPPSTGAPPRPGRMAQPDQPEGLE